MKRIYFLLVLFNIISFNIYSQGNTCAGALPFCAGGTTYTFPNTAGAGSAGNSIGCLGSAPNPAWFYFQISTSGNLNFTLTQGNNAALNNLDVDFITWGPFSATECVNLYDFPNNNTSIPNNIVACSFSAAPIENFSIPGAIAGQIYMIMITNFSNQPGQITLTQTNLGQPGAGATDCNILCPLGVTGGGTFCPGTPATLSATISGLSTPAIYAGATFNWTSTAPGFVPPPTNVGIITVTVPGTYTVVINKPGCVPGNSASATYTAATTPNTGTPNPLTACFPSTIFNLSQNTPVIINGLPGLTIDYHTNQLSANDGSAGGSRILTPGAYNAPGPFPQTIYVSIEDAASCIYTTSFTISQVNCCESITASTGSQSVCLGGDPTALTATTSATVANSIAFVYFPTQQTGTNMYAGGTLLGTVTPVAGVATFDPTVLGTGTSLPNVAGTYYVYAIINPTPVNPICLASQEIVVTVNNLPNAGSNGSIVVCDSSVTPIDLNTIITGQQAGGAWTQATGSGGAFTAATGTFIPASGATTSTFTYTINGVAPCTTATSTATVTINPQPNAGNDGSVVVCDSSVTPIDLNTVITGQQSGGTWTQATGTGGTFVAATGIFTPASGATTSTFTYTLNGVAPCTLDTSTATVTINPQPNAGNDGSIVVCDSSATSINLNTLITGQQLGGTWTQATGTGGTFVAATGSFTPAPGATTSTFTYTLNGIAPCTSDSSTATVTINPLPNAGNNGSVVVCDSSATPIDLNTIITGQQSGGTWTQATGTGGTFVAATGTFTPAPGATTSTFTYTLNGIAPCSFVTSTATVTINTQPNAGNNGSVVVCDSSAALIDLNTLITGQQLGGTWTQATGTGGTFVAATGTFTPAPGATTSTFTYTLSGVAPCTTATSIATVTINPQPNAGNDGSIVVCDSSTTPINLNTIITGQQSGGTWTRTSGLGGTFVAASGTYTPAPGATTSIFTYTLNGIAPCIADTSTVTINFTSPPIITVPTPYVVCDDNNDGLSCLFFLHTKDIEIAPLGLTVEYYETLTNAQTGAAINIITQNPYCSINNTGLQTLYVRVYDPAAPSCYSITTLQLIVNPRPIPNAAITDYVLCDVTNPGDGFEVFDLHTKDLEIANGLPLSDYTISYYLTQGDAISQTGPLPNLYQNAIANFQTIWINISNNLTGCSSVAAFNLVVNPLPLVVAPPPMFECSNGAIMTAAFNLSLNDSIISGGTPGVAVTYYLNCTDAQNEVNPLPIPYTNISNPQVVCVRVETIATGCYDTTQLTLNVTQGPIANNPPPLQFCDPNNDGIGVFDLNDATPSIVGGALPAGVSISYHETQTDAQIGANPLVSPYTNITAWSQIIYVRVFYTLTGCANYVQLKLNVNTTPEATEPSDYHECDDNFDGFAVFDLTTVTPQILGSINPATHLVTYHTSLLDAQNGVGAISNVLNYTNATINNQTLWVRVETTATGCYDIVELDLIVDPLPLSTQPAYAPYSLCDNTAPLGFEQFDLQSREAAILLGQLGMSVTFYPSLAEANAQINAIPPGLYTNIAPFVQTLGVVITNTATGCFVISTMDIRVEPLPTPIPPLQPYTVCDNDQDGFAQFDLCTLTAAINVGGYIISYHETQIDAQQNNNALACSYQNIQSFTQTIWVRAEDALTQCVSTMPILLQVDMSPILPTPLSNLVLCDEDSNNQNGVTGFDFSTQTATLLAAQTSAGSNYTVTYYNTQLDAENGVGNIVSTSNYQGFDTEVIWVRIEHNTTGCYIVGSFTLEVNIPLALTAPTPLNVCDNDANPNDLHTTFDLTVKDNEITGGLPGYNVTYYPTWPVTPLSVAIATPTAYVNVPPAVQTLGVEVTSPDGCKSYTTLDIRVLPVPTPRNNPPVLPAQCENALNSGVQTMDITVNAAYIQNNDPNVTLHYFHTLADATSIPPQNEILLPTGALVGDPTLLNVNPRPLNLIQYVYVVVSSNLFIDYNAQNCYTIVQQPFIINPLPIVAAIGAQQMCEGDPTGNDGFEQFDLTAYTPLLLAGNATIPVSNYTVAFYTDAALTNLIANPTTYTNITNPQTIYAQVTNTSTGCSNSAPFDIIVNPKPLLTPPAPFATCDNELNDNDGYYLYPLDVLIPGILNGQSPANYTVSFYHTQADADATPPTNAITNLSNYQAQTETIWIRVEDNTTGCYQIGSFDILIEQYATPVIETVNNVNTICVNFITNAVERDLTLFASNTTVYLSDPQPSYDYQWYLDGVAIPGAVSPGYTIDTPLPNNVSAVYTVSMTTTGALGCATTSQGFTVFQSGPAVVQAGTIGYTITDAFTENQILTVMVEGWGTYQYSLNDGPRQDSPIFYNVPLGTNVITVWDTEGGLDYSCDALVIQQIQVIDYPHYFTPNGDGYHDTWNIVGLEDQPNTKIYIFDRFGKLIKQISSTGEGWDGTYNGVLMPSTDYWFTVDYQEQDTMKQFKAHFTLKR